MMPKASTVVVFLHLAIFVLMVSVQLRQAEACSGGGGWRSYGRKCYKLVTNVKKSWPDAKVHCLRLGGRLAVPTNGGEESFVSRMAKSHRLSMTWIGVFETTNGACWMSAVTHRPIRYTDWGVGEPNNALKKSEDCVAIYSGVRYKWIDSLCPLKNPFICEKRRRGRRC